MLIVIACKKDKTPDPNPILSTSLNNTIWVRSYNNGAGINYSTTTFLSSTGTYTEDPRYSIFWGTTGKLTNNFSYSQMKGILGDSMVSIDLGGSYVDLKGSHPVSSEKGGSQIAFGNSINYKISNDSLYFLTKGTTKWLFAGKKIN